MTEIPIITVFGRIHHQMTAARGGYLLAAYLTLLVLVLLPSRFTTIEELVTMVCGIIASVFWAFFAMIFNLLDDMRRVEMGGPCKYELELRARGEI